MALLPVVGAGAAPASSDNLQAIQATNALIRLQALRREFPIPPADPLMAPRYAEVVSHAREVDVDVRGPSALMYYGLTLFQEDPPRYEEAAPFLEEALREDPSQAAAWEGLGWCYIKTSYPDKARRLWDYYRELMPGQASPYALLAQLDLLDQNWAGMDANLSKALRIQPKNYEWRIWHAQNLLRLGQPDAAEKCFRQLIKEDPDRFDLQIQLANILVYRLEYDEAERILRHVNEEMPDVPDNMLAQARLELRLGALRRADQLCLDVLSIDSNNTAAVSLRADVAEIADLADLSVKRLQDVIDTAHDPVLRAQLRMRLANRMLSLRKRNRLGYSTSKILETMRLAKEEDPGNSDIRIAYAQQLYADNELRATWQEAKDVLEKINPNHVLAKQLLFEVALQERRYSDAEQILNDIYSKFDATDPMRWYFLARLQTARGEYSDALSTLAKMEKSTEQGTVFSLLYHDLTESDWMPVTSVRRLSEHLLALQREGWTIVSPAELPSILGPKATLARDADEADAQAAEEIDTEHAPALARALDWVRWEVTGTRRIKPPRREIRPSPYRKPGQPMKVAVVTFDDGLRAALQLGESVSKDVGAPFGMFAITKPTADYSPAYAGWGELRAAAQSGAWVIGSHLYGAHTPGIIDPDSFARVHALVNRVWLPEKDRIESMNEWDRRMRHEFRQSKQIVTAEMGSNDCPVAMVAYPYGDVGQGSYSNLKNVRNPVNSILSEAARRYQVGFIESPGGYTSVGDNLLAVRRYEPMWSDEGDDVVEHAYDSHPSFMARRMRVEIAFLMDKPHLADAMIDSLRHDGYPEELCGKIKLEVRAHFRNASRRSLDPLITSSAAVAIDQTTGGQSLQAQKRDTQAAVSDARESGANVVILQEDGGLDTGHALSDLPDSISLANVYKEGNVSSPWLKLSAPSVGVEFFSSRANDQYEQLGWGLNGGVNINPKLRLSGSYRHSELSQTVIPHYNRNPANDKVKWVHYTADGNQDNVAYTGRGTNNKDSNGNAVSYADLQRDPQWQVAQRTVSTQKYKYKSYRNDFRGRITYRTDDGVTFSGSLGQASFDLDPNGKNPKRSSLFEDYSADNEGTDDGRLVGDFSVSWSPRDDMSIYWFYAHDLAQSAIDEFSLDTMGVVLSWKPGDLWELSTRWQGWAYADHNNMFYIQGDGYYNIAPDIGFWIGADASVVNASEGNDYYWTPAWDQRMTGVLRYRSEWIGYSFTVDLLAGIHKEGAHSLTRSEDADIVGEETDWEWCYGAATRYSKRINRYADIFIDVRMMSLKQYVDHSLLIGFTLTF